MSLPKLKAPNSAPSPSPVTIAPWVWLIFAGSLALAGGALFVTSWTSTGPSFLPSELHTPATERLLPEFLHLPSDPWDAALPTLSVLAFCFLLRFIPATNWTRLIVKGIFIALTLRYLVWRTIATFNFESLPSTIFSLLLYAIEVIGIFVMLLVAVQSVWSMQHRRSQQADHYEQQVRSGAYLPSVDVFVPSYNEPEFIVRRTVMGCQAMDYPNKTVYLLDDTRRPQMRELAAKLGCGYIALREGEVNKHAKAGNLNRALPQTHGELVTIMDADFVPFKNYLTRIVGFFQEPDVAMVQTPQDFYNPDHHARNLGVDHLVPNDLTGFFSFGQTTRDTFNSVMCCGTSYVVRRRTLEDVGGYYTRCVAEDSPTSTFMLTRGWRILYLAERLSMGESTRNYADFLKQRLRWLQGNLQIFYCADEVPIWRKMSLAQQSFWLVQYIGCFNPLFRVIFLLSPLVSIYLGISPHVAPVEESLYYFLPYMLFQVGTFSWSVNYTVSFFWNELYEIILCFPGLQRLYFTLRKPFGKPFVVTPKGVTAKTKRYNLNRTYPLLIIVALTLLALALHIGGAWLGIWQTLQSDGFSVVFFWLIYNLIMVSIAIVAAIDQPERRVMDRFPLQTRCRVVSGDATFWGYTRNLSEGGAEVVLATTETVPWNASVLLEFPDYDFAIVARLLRIQPARQQVHLGVAFETLSIEHNRQLVEMLYTEVTWWKQDKRPGSLDAALAMLRALLQLKPLRNRFSA
jgi:cellulose synthase (UDP-forming)